MPEREWVRPDLSGTVALVAGATRGAGRAISVELGACGATVYCSGRSTRGGLAGTRSETIDETAELVTAAGGRGIAVRCDHTVAAEVAALVERIAAEQGGRLGLLVNDVWGGDELAEWGTPFWELDLGKALLMQERAVWSHLITARLAAPLLVAGGSGLIVEVTDGDNLDYRGNLPYSLAKSSSILLAQGMAADLRAAGHERVSAVAVTPGFLRSEAMLDHFGVSEDNWRDAVAKDPYFAESETPHYLGRAVASLAGDPRVHERNGQALASWHLARHYGFRDVDGRQPHWGEFFERMRLQEAGPAV
ncbi:MAG TPA: SDR family oxidoreductase [Deinococcales bacterium]|nr:SDR family oxidoreductase [Deinococcales bacterium]